MAKRTAELVGKKNFKMVNCHLGNGSLSAIKDDVHGYLHGLEPLGRCAHGYPLRDIDACVVQPICNKYGMSVDDCLTMLNKKSGMLGLRSGVSSDFRDLGEGADKGNEDCKLALEKFAYEVAAKYVGFLRCRLKRASMC